MGFQAGYSQTFHFFISNSKGKFEIKTGNRRFLNAT